MYGENRGVRANRCNETFNVEREWMRWKRSVISLGSFRGNTKDIVGFDEGSLFVQRSKGFLGYAHRK